jgi:2-haloacid dehalogenase
METNSDKLVAFDVLRTLFSLNALCEITKEEFPNANIPKYFIQYWWSQNVREAQAISICGDYTDILRANLIRTISVITGKSIRNEIGFESKIDHILQGIQQLKLKSDAMDALKILKKSDWKCYCLTNGSLLNTKKPINNERMKDLILDVYSVECVRKYKPFREVYVMLPPYDINFLVSSRAWDTY